MKYRERIILKNGKNLLLRNAEASDGEAVLDNFNQTHAETDWLLTYPDENTFDVEKESRFLERKAASQNEIELVAVMDGKVVGTAGISTLGTKYKVAHRAEFGVSILKEYWGLGIGRAMMEACIECAREAGYVQLELSVVADNARAVSMYRKAGFVEYGRESQGVQIKDIGLSRSGLDEIGAVGLV